MPAYLQLDLDRARQAVDRFPGIPSEHLQTAITEIENLRKSSQREPMAIAMLTAAKRAIERGAEAENRARRLEDELLRARQALLWARANDVEDVPPLSVTQEIHAAQEAAGTPLRIETDAVADLARRVPPIEAHRELENRVAMIENVVDGGLGGARSRANAIERRIDQLHDRLEAIEDTPTHPARDIENAIRELEERLRQVEDKVGPVDVRQALPVVHERVDGCVCLIRDVAETVSALDAKTGAIGQHLDELDGLHKRLDDRVFALEDAAPNPLPTGDPGALWSTLDGKIAGLQARVARLEMPTTTKAS